MSNIFLIKSLKYINLNILKNKIESYCPQELNIVKAIAVPIIGENGWWISKAKSFSFILPNKTEFFSYFPTSSRIKFFFEDNFTLCPKFKEYIFFIGFKKGFLVLKTVIFYLLA